MTDGAPAFWADVVLAVHFAVAAFIVLGLPAIWIGAAAGWRFARNRWFRWTHAALMGFVLSETVAGSLCPLTKWEAALRRAAGQEGGEPVSCVQYWLGRVLFPDIDPAWFAGIYAAFFGLVILTLFFVPVRKAEKPAAPDKG